MTRAPSGCPRRGLKATSGRMVGAVQRDGKRGNCRRGARACASRGSAWPMSWLSSESGRADRKARDEGVRGALTTHHRAHELRCCAREAHAVAKRLRRKQEEVPKVM